MKLSEIKGMSLKEIKRLPESTKKSLYTNLRRSVTQRAHAFQKAGLKPRAPKSMQNLQPASQTSMSSIERILGSAESFLESKLYTKSGYLSFHKERRKALSDKLGMKLTDEDYARYSRFMNDMAAQMGAGWHYVSSQAVELFAQAKRLNLNVNQFKRNLDYWMENVDKLQYARPISRGSGVKPSDYIKQLKMESVTSWRRRQ